MFIIGATNRPEDLDEAARRRFQKRIYIPLPSEDDRAYLVKRVIGEFTNNLTANDIKHIAKKTKNFSGCVISITYNSNT